VTGDDPVAEDRVRAPIVARHERIELDEGSSVEQQVEALARRQLAGSVLALDALGSPALHRCRPHRVESVESLVGV
jgi:hypothetical protein